MNTGYQKELSRPGSRSSGVRLIIVGNSVGIIIRPPRVSRLEENVSQALAGKLVGTRPMHVENRCRGAHVLKDIAECDLDHIAANAPDYVVVISGINEAVSRPLPRTLFQFLNKRRRLRSRSVSALLKMNGALNRYVFPHLIKLFRLRGWYSPGHYAADLKTLVHEMHKETGCIVIVSAILPCSDRIERQLPGSKASIRAFNAATTAALSEISYVDIVDLMEDIEVGQESTYVPDGIHMNARAHKLLADRIFDIISSHEPALHLSNANQ